MASLTTEAILVGSVDTPDGFTVDVWNVKLSGAASDTFTVPGVATTAGIGILLKGKGSDPLIPPKLSEDSLNDHQASITAAVSAINEGSSTVTVTNSASPKRRNQVIICTLRQRGMINNQIIDEDPT